MLSKQIQKYKTHRGGIQMSVTVRGIHEAKNFLVQASEDAKVQATKTKSIAEDVGALVSTTNDTNLHEIATAMTGTLDAILTGAVKTKLVSLFTKYHATLEAFISTNPAHKEEYGNAVQEIEDAIAVLKSTDLEIGAIPAPEGGGEYSTKDIDTIANLVADSFQAIGRYAGGLRDNFGEVKGSLIDELATSLDAIIEDLLDECNTVSSALHESVEGLVINQSNMGLLADMFTSIGGSIGDSATASSASKAKEVASQQSAMSID